MAVKIAFLGLGKMGGLMTKHLVAAGYDVTGYDPVAKAMSAAKKNGAKTAKTPSSAAKGADVVCSSLPHPAAVRDAYLGSGGVLKILRRGNVVFELSTSSVDLAREIAVTAKKKGVSFLDAPVSGSIPHLEKNRSQPSWGATARPSKNIKAFSRPSVNPSPTWVPRATASL